MFVERHFTTGNEEIVRLCTLSKDLYNRANYFMRQTWFNQQHLKYKQLPDLSQLYKETKNLECYKAFGNTKTATQTVRKVLSDWSSFKAALLSYSIDPSKFTGEPKPPKYKKKLAQIIFFNETIKGGTGKKPLTKLEANNGCFSVPFKEGYRQVIITPKVFGFMIDVIYEKEKVEQSEKKEATKEKWCANDVGANNLLAITYDQMQSPILINGRIVKSINQWYNKKPCKSRLKKRYFRLENYFHHVSKGLIQHCVKHKIGRVIIGKNNGWKQNLNLGKKTNQNFEYIPFCKLFDKIKYKAAIAGIEVVFTEESYTSKSSFLDNDPLPKFGDKSIPKFRGNRKHRGLFVTNYGFAVHSDVNGSLNIGRKVIPELNASKIGDRSIVAMPVRINPLRNSNGEGWSVNSFKFPNL